MASWELRARVLVQMRDVTRPKPTTVDIIIDIGPSHHTKSAPAVNGAREPAGGDEAVDSIDGQTEALRHLRSRQPVVAIDRSPKG